MNKIQPIKRSEISQAKVALIPDSIINAVNELLKKSWNGSFAVIKSKELMKLVLESDSTLTDQIIFNNRFFDFEPIFRKEGWVVTFETPDRDQSFDSYFKFE